MYFIVPNKSPGHLSLMAQYSNVKLQGCVCFKSRETSVVAFQKSQRKSKQHRKTRSFTIRILNFHNMKNKFVQWWIYEIMDQSEIDELFYIPTFEPWYKTSLEFIFWWHMSIWVLNFWTRKEKPCFGEFFRLWRKIQSNFFVKSVKNRQWVAARY